MALVGDGMVVRGVVSVLYWYETGMRVLSGGGEMK